jgi:hypothetical protein
MGIMLVIRRALGVKEQMNEALHIENQIWPSLSQSAFGR